VKKGQMVGRPSYRLGGNITFHREAREGRRNVYYQFKTCNSGTSAKWWLEVSDEKDKSGKKQRTAG